MEQVEVRRPGIGGVVVPLAICVVLVVAVYALDEVLGERAPLFERPPVWSSISVLRTVLLAIASWSLAVHGRRLAATVLPGAAPSSADHETTLAAAVGVAVAVGAAILVAVDPGTLSSLVLEDGPVEWVSALLAFGAAALLVAAIVRFRRAGSMSRRAVFVAAAIAGLSLLIGLEEISWFQRVLDFESPEGFRPGDQSEFNLHNQATSLTETLYYSGAFVGLVVVPALAGDRELPRGWSDLAIVVPGRAVLYGSIMGAAIVYEMWEIIPIQVAFFASVALALSDRAMVERWRIGPPNRRDDGGGRRLVPRLR